MECWQVSIFANGGVRVYFCDPPSPWQRDTNENTNLLLRQYFPRRTDLSPFSQAQLVRHGYRVNEPSGRYVLSI
jgi:IS30 family transposase